MKNKLFIALAIVALFIFLRPFGQDYLDLIKYNREIENLQIGNPEIAAMEDGEYEGEHIVYSIEARALVQIRSGEIARIDLEHEHERGYNAEEVTGRVIEAQSLDVEMVSGATHSSKVILKAIEKALTEEE